MKSVLAALAFYQKTVYDQLFCEQLKGSYILNG